MDRIVYFFFRFFVALISILPFRVIYILSDVLFFILYHLIGYRKKVVYRNLTNSFPEKTHQEINAIARDFYHHLTDVTLESFKAFTMSEQGVIDRFHMKPSPFLDKIYQEGRSVIVVAGHYNNWEWPGIAAGRQMKHKPVGFYKPLTNPYVDAYVRKTRVQGRSALVSINDTAAVFNTDWGEPSGFYMIADQSPPNVRLAYWVRFLNQETATLHGPEKYARVYNMPVVYTDVQKIGRGNYESEFILLCENPAETKTGEITAKFMKMLEERIREKPQYYLWSHRRWKHRRSENQNSSPKK
jgi:Kdo2-lipid IVA lauroyltransferase/acyltransferase